MNLNALQLISWKVTVYAVSISVNETGLIDAVKVFLCRSDREVPGV